MPKTISRIPLSYYPITIVSTCQVASSVTYLAVGAPLHGVVCIWRWEKQTGIRIIINKIKKKCWAKLCTFWMSRFSGWRSTPHVIFSNSYPSNHEDKDIFPVILNNADFTYQITDGENLVQSHQINHECKHHPGNRRGEKMKPRLRFVNVFPRTHTIKVSQCNNGGLCCSYRMIHVSPISRWFLPPRQTTQSRESYLLWALWPGWGELALLMPPFILCSPSLGDVTPPALSSTVPHTHNRPERKKKKKSVTPPQRIWPRRVNKELLMLRM